MIDTNTYGPLRLVQSVAPAWRERGSGVIVNVSSVQGRVATPLAGAYAMSKYALEALSESLHYELTHFGIRVVIIQPGYIAPGMKASPAYDGPADYRQLWEEWNGTDGKVTGPAGRPGSEVVGVAIADAIEDPDTPLRVARRRRRQDDLRRPQALRRRRLRGRHAKDARFHLVTLPSSGS